MKPQRLQQAVLASLVFVAGEAVAQQVLRRGGESTLQGSILSIDDGGVTIQTEFGARHFVPWDRVREVIDPTREARIDEYREMADALWRARSRIERGDHALAEPLLEALFEDTLGKTHESALVVAEGLLRCRLSRGANELAVVPLLEVIRLRREGVETISYSQLPPIIDDTFEVSPFLPPWWLNPAARDAVVAVIERYDSRGDEVVAAMALLYARSMQERIELVQDSALPNHSGVQLLALCVESICTDPSTRQRARDRLVREDARRPAFAVAWGRFFAGSSMLKETGIVRRQRGLVHLLHLPAMHEDSQKYLAGAALREAAVELAAQGEANAAAALRSELETRYPRHPAIRSGQTHP